MIILDNFLHSSVQILRKHAASIQFHCILIQKLGDIYLAW